MVMESVFIIEIITVKEVNLSNFIVNFAKVERLYSLITATNAHIFLWTWCALVHDVNELLQSSKTLCILLVSKVCASKAKQSPEPIRRLLNVSNDYLRKQMCFISESKTAAP